EVNLLGTGHTLGVHYFERDATRDYGVRYFTPQLMGTRWDLETQLARSRAGTRVAVEIAYPFVVEVSRWAGRQSYLRDDRYFDYLLAPQDPDIHHVLMPV